MDVAWGGDRGLTCALGGPLGTAWPAPVATAKTPLRSVALRTGAGRP